MRDDELATMARTCTALLREVVAEMTRRLMGAPTRPGHPIEPIERR